MYILQMGNVHADFFLSVQTDIEMEQKNSRTTKMKHWYIKKVNFPTQETEIGL